MKETLSDKKHNAVVEELKYGYFFEEDVKEKIQNVQRGLKKFKSLNNETKKYDYLLIPIDEFNKIFNEEIGKGLLK